MKIYSIFKSYTAFLVWCILSFFTFLGVLGVTNYLADILHRNGHDLHGIYFNLKGISSFGEMPYAALPYELPEGLPACMEDSTLLVYQEGKPTEFILVATKGKHDLFGGWFDGNPLAGQAGAYGAKAIGTYSDNLQKLPAYGSFLVDYGIFYCCAQTGYYFTDETIFYLASYRKDKLEAALGRILSYAGRNNMEYAGLSVKQVAASDFLGGLSLPYLFWGMALLCLFATDAAGSVLYLCSRRKVSQVYFLLGIEGYQKQVLLGLMSTKLLLGIIGGGYLLWDGNPRYALVIGAYYLLGAAYPFIISRRILSAKY